MAGGQCPFPRPFREGDTVIIIDEPEGRFQRRVIDLATELGWEWLHIAQAPKNRNSGWGTLFRGWPDLTLVRDKRLIFVELKAEKAPPPTVTQQLVMARLARTGAETYVWRPSQWNLILDVLT